MVIIHLSNMAGAKQIKYNVLGIKEFCPQHFLFDNERRGP